MDSGHIAASLADFSSNCLVEEASVRTAIRRAILDSIGVAVAGSDHQASRIIVDHVRAPATARGAATIIASPSRADPANAALANAVMAHVLDFDDTLLPTRLHPSAALVPALLAVAEAHDLSGERVIDGFAVGYELMARLAEATYPDFAERGWHGTGVFGAVGVAAAVGRLISLDAERMAHAIGLGATGGSGVVHVFGSMAKAINIGRAAATGIQSAYLARDGFTASSNVFGDDRSILDLYAAQPTSARLERELGADWAVQRNGYKPYPCGVVAHAAIDAVLALRERAPATELQQLRLTVSEETVRLMGNPDPTGELQAKFSVRYVAAAAWLDGVVDPSTFEDERVVSTRSLAAMQRTAISFDDSVAQDAAIAEVETTDGWQDRQEILHARGTLSRPMTDAELAEKFLRLVGQKLDGERLLDTIMKIEETRVRDLMKQLAAD